jgi:hypothetical protein
LESKVLHSSVGSYLLALWAWTNYLNSLSHSFFTYKMETITVLNSKYSCEA